MGVKARVPLDPVADLKRRLPQARSLRSCVHAWWNDHELANHPAIVGKRIACALIEQRMAAAGTYVLAELLAEHLRAADVAVFARLLGGGHLAEIEVVDAFCVKVLGAVLQRVRGRAEVARTIAGWRAAENPWQRRASCVAFTGLASHGDPAITESIFAVCATVVWSHERFDQTAVGWVLRELSRAEPARVDAFFVRNARFMSRECARIAVEQLPAPRQQALLAHHKRATTLRR